MTRPLPWAVSLALAAGCAGSEPKPVAEAPADAPVVESVSLGWVTEVAEQPEALAALLATERTGWTALHAHDYGVARANLTTPAHRARADMALAVLHDDLAHLMAVTTSRLFPAWEQRGGLPAKSSARAVAALAAWCAPAAHDRPATAWAEGIPDGHPAAALAAALTDDLWALPPDDVPYGQRIALYRRAEAGDVEALELAAGEPLVSEEAHGFTRHFYDPCAHESLSEGWWHTTRGDLGASDGPDDRRGLAPLLDQGLAGRLFSPWLSTHEPTAGPLSLFGADRPWPAGGPVPPGDVQGAREAVRTLDAALDEASKSLLDAATPEGAQAVSALGLVPRWRQEWLVLQARKHLRQDDAAVALALLERAYDPTHPEVGPFNSPSLFVLRAEAEVRSGRTRQALDALQPLEGRIASVRGVVEFVGDLAVLQGLDRQGDSKESQ